ncbi:MAG: GHKL domain-containing protein [Magnetococcales bacterium]|nr:GHKL domain-containing protein [Magnetococcales bacterium]
MHFTGIMPLQRMILAIAIAGVVISVLVFNTMTSQLDHHSRLEFHWLAKDRVGALQRGLEETIHNMEILGNLLQERDPTTEGFTQLSQTFLSKIHGLQELIWIPRLGDPPTSPLRAYGSAPPLFPQGHDFQADLHLNTLFARAARLNRIVVTTLFRPTTSEEIIEQFVVTVPIHPPPPSSDTPETGILLGVFDLEELVQQAIRLLEPRGVQILILEQDENGQPRFIDSYYSRLESKPDDPVDRANWQQWLTRQPNMLQETIAVADKRWIITAIPSKHLLSGEEFPHTPWMILFGGLFITGLLVFFLRHVASNLNEKNRLYSELKQSALKLRILFNQYPDTILTVDRRGMVLLTNRPEVRMLGDLFGADQAELHSWHEQALRKVYTTGEMDHFQFPYSDSQWREVRFVPIRADGRIDEVMILGSDITEKHAHQEQAVRHARLASLGILAAGMAHEINNPNNTIQFNIVALNRSWPDIAAVLRRYRDEHGAFALGGVPVDHALEMLPSLLESILGNSRRISGIVNNLKHMARPDPGVQICRIELHKVIRHVISIMQHPIKRHTDHFEVSIPEELPDLQGNPLQLEQLFLNLLLNALESLRSRQARVTLDATLSEDRKWVIVRVADEGAGMTEQEMTNMFTPFFTTKGEQGGIGMGLSIVWDIVKRHEGTIQTESQPGTGTTFTVSLPVPAPQPKTA